VLAEELGDDRVLALHGAEQGVEVVARLLEGEGPDRDVRRHLALRQALDDDGAVELLHAHGVVAEQPAEGDEAEQQAGADDDEAA
jgi:hypothetical protein